MRRGGGRRNSGLAAGRALRASEKESGQRPGQSRRVPTTHTRYCTEDRGRRAWGARCRILVLTTRLMLPHSSGCSPQLNRCGDTAQPRGHAPVPSLQQQRALSRPMAYAVPFPPQPHHATWSMLIHADVSSSTLSSLTRKRLTSNSRPGPPLDSKIAPLLAVLVPERLPVRLGQRWRCVVLGELDRRKGRRFAN